MKAFRYIYPVLLLFSTAIASMAGDLSVDIAANINTKASYNGTIIYVKSDAAPGGGGTSWDDAFNLLQDALDDADPNDEIWVAAGTYLPTSDYGLGIGDRGKHFRMKNRVAIYGGFPATGDPVWDDRNPNTYETILSGDLAGNDEPIPYPVFLLNDPNRSDNCYHIFYHPEGTDLDPNAMLDGFTITRAGSGMSNNFSSPTVTNCTFSGNGSSGMSNWDDSNPTVTYCTFSGNSAPIGGGMENINYSNPMVTNCTFINNWATAYGGGMYNQVCNPVVIHCIFSGNTASPGVWSDSAEGGGMFNFSSSPIVINCIFSGNSTNGDSGMMYNDLSDPKLSNCIIWGNTAPQIYNVGASSSSVTYSDVQGGWPGEGNIDADPLFVDADGADDIFGTADDNLRLTPCSSCLDAGDNSALPESVEEDLDGNSRIANGTVDMGAYEFPGIVYVDDDAPLDPGPGDFSISDPAECGYPEHPFDGIQEAIDCARNGHTILVLPGNYIEAFNFISKSITVTSGQEEPAILEAPGNYVATFQSGEDPNSILKNFILRNSNIGVFCNFAAPTLKYLTVVENGSGIEAWNGSDPQISNSIFWNNLNSDLLQCQAVYSCIERESAGLGNLSSDPLFADPGNLDYHLKSQGWRWRDLIAHGSHWTWDGVTSPCIDAGNPGSALGAEPISIPEDPNNEWGLNLRANMGAYGGTAQASMAIPGWRLQSDADNDGRVDMKELIMLRDQWLIWEIREPYCDFNRDGIVNLGDYQVLAKEWLKEALRLK